MSNTGSKSSPALIFLFGPTGVGKTRLLEEFFAGCAEVISADALQVYCGFSIGTAKPSSDLRRRLPHHLIDIRHPDEPYSAGDFVHDAEALIPAIQGRGRLPVVSGGTAFYFKNLLFGLPQVPAVPPEVRRKMGRRLSQEGLAALRRELRQVDPVTADRLAPGDTYRICRALEVWYASGRRLSDFPLPDQPRRRALLIGLNRPRPELYKRIDQRVDQMFDQGLLEEFQGLAAAGWREETEAMKGIGYRQFWQWRREGCLSLETLKERIRRDSRRYAKRQITFFKSLPGVHWIHPDEKEALRDLTEKALAGIIAEDFN